MIIGVYGDCHLTKNMRSLQSIWDESAGTSIHYMYNKFDDDNIELAVCLGDFFDAPRLEARHMKLVLPILEDINSRSYPTYILLGNHEADDSESNILDFISNYENIHPITSPSIIEDMCFIPYYVDPTTVDMKDKIVFTHHDIYGSSLAAGKTKASFGLDPRIFQEARLVMNGHVHLRSTVTPNVLNAGSLLVSQQGELKLGTYPAYYIVDTHEGVKSQYNNRYSMIYLTLREEESDRVLKADYNLSRTVLRVEYAEEIPESYLDVAHVSWRKDITDIHSAQEIVRQDVNFDMKDYIVRFIQSDHTVPDSQRESYINKVLELLS